jgi:uncharacterized protein
MFAHLQPRQRARRIAIEALEERMHTWRWRFLALPAGAADPERVSLGYTVDSQWRNRAEFMPSREAIKTFLTPKWNRELDYRLVKELWAFRENRIAVRLAYEWHDDSGNWFRSYGNENWEFDEHGLMRLRIASINDLPIHENDRKYHWPLGRRPDEHPSLSDLGL